MNNRNIDYAPKDSSHEGIRSGPYLAKVVSHLDPTYMGVLEVELLRPVGNQARTQGQLHQVKMMTPFYGVTGVDYVGNQDDYNNTQKSYGMWFVPPDVGTSVMVIFIDGDPKRGYWIGCVQDEAMNFMVPGIAATQYVSNGSGRLPVAEYNKKVNDKPIPDESKITKPKHPLADVFTAQGLLKDDIRGITTSSARREVPSMVFGVSTPGPLDKRSGSKTGTIGKSENSANNAFVSRLGGSTFVMDDGDDKFLRKTFANSGPPDYASVAQGETGGQPTIPHNELIRIRTRTGHQILLHNSEDLIYIGNASGTTWIELTSNGKIDIFAQDSISIHTGNDLNVTAGRDINFSCAGDFNVNAGKNVKITSGSDLQVKAGANGLITVGAMIGLTAGGAIAGSAPTISWNGGTAPLPATVAPKPVRIPQHEPWNQHENLDPKSFIPSKTQASTSSPSTSAPSFFQKPTTKVDPFSKTRSAKK